MKKYSVTYHETYEENYEVEANHLKKLKKFFENESILVQKMVQSSAATVGVT